MLQYIYAYLDSPWWDTTMVVITTWGIVSLWMLITRQSTRSPRRRLFMWSGLVMLLLSVVFSMVFEGFLPRTAGMSTRRQVETAIGMFGFLAAPMIMVYACWRFVRDTIREFDAATPARFGRVRPGPGETGQPHVPVSTWLSAWMVPLFYLAFGFVLMFVAASVYHETRFPLTFAWEALGLL